MESITARVSRLTSPAKWKKWRLLQPAGPAHDEILVISQCGHAFHSLCLVSWFLEEKHTCPMCRVRYYTPPREKRHRFGIETMMVSALGGF
ncbi:hypothetical protein F5Y09DRAFT_318628 [Xylaria sp. FL1042]|nr:hypothetical protein F5Y09DRAFT_318628 [Xylaria sp. FL1042]